MLFTMLFVKNAFSMNCSEAIVQKFNGESLTALKQMLYSGRDFDDLGRPEECESSNNKYFLLTALYDISYVNLGICLPSSCTTSGVSNFFVKLVEKLQPKSINSKDIQVFDTKSYSEEPLSFSAYVTILILVLFVALGALGTWFDDSSNKFPTEYKNFILEFSLKKNIEKLIAIPDNKNSLTAINGFRVLATLAVISYHTFNIVPSAAIGNPNRVLDQLSDFSHKIFISFRSSVEVFFIISGFLLSFLTLNEIKKNKGEFNWTMFIVHRYLRLSPVFYSIYMIDLTLLRYIGSGPQWPLHELKYQKGCKDYWLSNFFYIQDLIPYNELPCFKVSWYIACDFKYFIISPAILLLYLKKKALGYMLCISIVLANFLYIGVISTYYEFTPSYYGGSSNDFESALIYFKPQARVSAFIVGIIMGILYREICDKHRSRLIAGNEKAAEESDFFNWAERKCLEISEIWVARTVLYLVGLIFIAWASFYVHDLDINGQDHWSQDFKSFYLATDKFIFSLGFSFWFFALILGHLQWLSTILSANIFVILSRLSFAVYLLHFIVLKYFAFTRNQRLFVNDFDTVYTIGSVIMISFILSTFFTLLIEMPLLSLERKYLKN